VVYLDSSTNTNPTMSTLNSIADFKADVRCFGIWVYEIEVVYRIAHTGDDACHLVFSFCGAVQLQMEIAMGEEGL
jgi:hypothetical protein